MTTLFHAVQLYFTRLKKSSTDSQHRGKCYNISRSSNASFDGMLDPSKFKLGNIKRSCWIFQSLRHCILNDFKTNSWLFIIQRETVSHGKYLTPHEINLCIHCEYWAFISLGWVILVSKLLFFSLPTVARKINHLDQNHPTAGNKLSQYSQWMSV